MDDQAQTVSAALCLYNIEVMSGPKISGMYLLILLFCMNLSETKAVLETYMEKVATKEVKLADHDNKTLDITYYKDIRDCGLACFKGGCMLLAERVSADNGKEKWMFLHSVDDINLLPVGTWNLYLPWPQLGNVFKLTIYI